MQGRWRSDAMWVRMALVLGLMTLALHASAAKPASLSVRTERAQDIARQVPSARGAIIEITSPSGIGRMTLAPGSGKTWPSPLRLRLRHAPGRPFRTLEGLDVSVDGKVVATRETMRVEVEPGWLEVMLPMGVAMPGKPLRVQWVDAYRR